MNFNRKQHWIVASLVIFTLILAACTPAVAPTGSADSGQEAATETAGSGLADRDPEVLVMLYWQASSLPSPYLSGGYKDVAAAAMTLEPLANYDPDGVMVPKLAVEIPTVENGGISEDLTSITWNLHEGVKWSDGSDFTAADVVFTWEYCTNEDTGCAQASAFEGISSVEAVDDLTVVINFEAPTPYPYNAFVGGSRPIISSVQFADCVGAQAQQCNDQNLSPLGTGPYKIVEFKVNDVVRYEPNEFYRGDAPFFKEAIFKGGGDAVGAARAVMETGEADYGWNLQVEPEILNEMQSDDAFGTIEAAFAGWIERLLMNQTNPDPELGDMRSEYVADGSNAHPFLVDTVIPKAMSIAIDRSLLAEQLYGFAGRPTCNIIPGPTAYVSTANNACLTQDIDGAKAMLDEAGIVDSDGDGIREFDGMPLKIRYQTSTNSVRQKTQALVKQWWTEIGIDTELLNHDAGVFFGGDPNSPDTYQKFYTDVEMYTHGPDIDPQLHFSEMLCDFIPTSENGWGGSNIARGCDEEFDALFTKLTQTPPGEARQELAKAMNDLHIQSYFQIPLVHRGSVSAFANNLTGVQMNAWDVEIWNIAEWGRE